MLTSIWFAMTMAFATTKALVFGRYAFRLRHSATCSALVSAEIAQLHAFLPNPAGGVGTHPSHAKPRCTPSKIHGESTQNPSFLFFFWSAIIIANYLGFGANHAAHTAVISGPNSEERPSFFGIPEETCVFVTPEGLHLDVATAAMQK